tara:strand:- start:10 stop:375 length:366 start_codon:yes stop_codon:yes gene_type:complete
MTIKNFNDLIFTDHGNNPNAVQAKLDLGNNLEISVVSMKDKETEFGSLYGSVKAGTYEVAVFHNDSMIPLSPFDDVLGWQTEDELTELMANLQGDFTAQFIANLYITRDEERADLGLTNHA